MRLRLKYRNYVHCPGCPYNSQREGTIVFNFFGGVGPIPRKSATPPSEKPKPEARQIPQRLSFSFFNQQGPFRVPRFEQLGQKKEKTKMKKEGFENAPCSRLTSASHTRPWFSPP
jgi:hypothetical protein